MDSSRLNRRVTIQSMSTTQDSYGQPVSTMTTLATVWAAVEPLTGARLFSAKQAQSEITLQITIRYLSTVEENMQIVYGAHTYIILYLIDPEMRHTSLELMCREVNA